MRFECSFLGVNPDDKLACAICCWVYDPAHGDDVGGIPSGVAFADLPDDWCCPDCDAPRHKFTGAE